MHIVIRLADVQIYNSYENDGQYVVHTEHAGMVHVHTCNWNIGNSRQSDEHL